MCGIISGCSFKNIVPDMLRGLQRLEYRGYDSSGLAALKNNQLHIIKRPGKVSKLVGACADLTSQTVIAHTRWATHGKPTQTNAHPHHHQKKLAWVHNGIIHNHIELQTKLSKLGYTFISDTDSEVIGHLLHYHLQQQTDYMQALQQTCSLLKGSYALVILDPTHPEKLYFSCFKSPLVIGIGHQEMFVASDPLALAEVASSFIYLRNNQAGLCTTTTYELIDMSTNETVKPEIHTFDWTIPSSQQAQHRHHMHREIFEQPRTTQQCLDYYLENGEPSSHLKQLLATIPNRETLNTLHLLGCGSSYYAALMGQYWLESHLSIHARPEISSEYRDRTITVPKNALLLSLSQSGETADTIGAVDHSKAQGFTTTATLCNTPHSSLVRDSDLFFPLLAGPEIGVASTKTFTAQILTLLILSMHLLPSSQDLRPIKKQLPSLPSLLHEVLELEQSIKAIAWQLASHNRLLFLGRGFCYPAVLEGALKLKELSYIHAHAYPAGELKHGPLALVDRHLTTVGLLPDDHLRAKTIANFKEIETRNGQLVIFFQGKEKDLHHVSAQTLKLPNCHPSLSPFIFTVALQLLAYHIAHHLGHDVDQPRNLAKSVTVE